MGGFPFDTEKHEVLKTLQTITSPGSGTGSRWNGLGVKDPQPPCEFGMTGKILFNTSDDMWRFLKDHKGMKLNYGQATLFHGIDKYEDDREVSRKTSRALKLCKQYLVEKGMLEAEASKEGVKKVLMGDWDMGIVRTRTPSGDIVRVFEKPRDSDLYRVAAGAATLGWDMRFAEQLAEINYGDGRKS